MQIKFAYLSLHYFKSRGKVFHIFTEGRGAVILKTEISWSFEPDVKKKGGSKKNINYAKNSWSFEPDVKRGGGGNKKTKILILQRIHGLPSQMLKEGGGKKEKKNNYQPHEESMVLRAGC